MDYAEFLSHVIAFANNPNKSWKTPITGCWNTAIINTGATPRVRLDLNQERTGYHMVAEWNRGDWYMRACVDPWNEQTTIFEWNRLSYGTLQHPYQRLSVLRNQVGEIECLKLSVIVSKGLCYNITLEPTDKGSLPENVLREIRIQLPIFIVPEHIHIPEEEIAHFVHC